MQDLTFTTLIAVFEEIFGRGLFWAMVVAALIVTALYLFVLIRDRAVSWKKFLWAQLSMPFGAIAAVLFVQGMTRSGFADIGGPIDVDRSACGGRRRGRGHGDFSLHDRVSLLAARRRGISPAAPTLLCRDGFHKAVADYDWVHCNHGHLGVAAVAFHDHHRHFATVQCLLQHAACVYIAALDHALAAAGLGHFGERGFLSCIGRLIAGGAIRAVVDDHQDIVVGNIVGDGRQSSHVGENRPITVDHDYRLGLRKSEAKTDA